MFGFDVNGRPIRVTYEHRCEGCDQVTHTGLSDGSTIGSSCGCDYLSELINTETNYIVVTNGSDGLDCTYIQGYKNAKAKYEELKDSGKFCSMAEVIKSNI